MPETPRSLPQWRRELGPDAAAVNTMKYWIEKLGLPAERIHTHYLVTPSDLRAFLVKNQQLSAARTTLRALERLDQPPPELAAATSSAGAVPPDPRELVRQSRAREATLSDQLDAASQLIQRLTADRNMWRARARASRDALRAQLELEDELDATAGD